MPDAGQNVGAGAVLFFVAFFTMPMGENMSVLPTNAAVFYGIFIDKDVDNF